jgi:hypothetical protein
MKSGQVYFIEWISEVKKSISLIFIKAEIGTKSLANSYKGRHDIQRIDTRYNDTQHSTS